ncbi:MAG: STAS domain-containing protein [Actinomycetota bacterium]|jgi:anti-sigma B factor antagonist|nr:STAS domain-containing protein [Actinomycetota bacterium]
MVMRVHAEQEHDATRVEVAGELDLSTGGELQDAVRRAVDEGRERLLVDLGGVTFIDSAGLGALLGAARTARAHRTAFGVSCPPGSEARLLIELSGTQQHLGLED